MSKLHYHASPYSRALKWPGHSFFLCGPRGVGKKLNFALSGSSARKLKRGGANLLAGRAITLYMESFTSFELATDFQSDEACRFGLLPMVVYWLTLPTRR